MPKIPIVPAAIAIVLAGCGGSTRPVAAGSWGTDQEAAFMANCDITSKGREAPCRCMLTYLEQRYTLDQIAQVVADGKIQDAVVTSNCIGRQ